MKEWIIVVMVMVLGCGEAVWDDWDADDDGDDSVDVVDGDITDPPDDAVVDGEEPDDAVADDTMAPDDGGLDDAVEPDDGAVDDAVPDDAAPDVSPPLCEGWYDEVYRLCWQNILPHEDDNVTYAEAVVYCRDLPLGGHTAGTWRVPSINQFRMLARGCMGTVPGGDCGLTDECRTEACWLIGHCTGCPGNSGPGQGGFYLPDSFSFSGADYETARFFWSTVAYSGDQKWHMDANRAGFGVTLTSEPIGVLCVRPM